MNHYSEENFFVMRKLEDTAYNLNPQKNSSDDKFEKTIDHPKHLSSACRLEICLWYFRVADYFEIPRETVSIGISFFDRYSTSLDELDDDKLLLVSLASFHLAVKLHESKTLRLCALVQLANNVVSPAQINEEEDIIMRALSWRLNPPTSEGFLYLFMEFMSLNIPPSEKYIFYSKAQYYTELSACYSRFLNHKPSTMAMASLLMALRNSSLSVIPSKERARCIVSLTRKTNLQIHSKEIYEASRMLRNIICGKIVVALKEKPNGSKLCFLKSFCGADGERSSEKSSDVSPVDSTLHTTF